VVFSADGALPLRIKEVVAVAVLAYRHDPSIEMHMRLALAAGSTLREILEGILAACTPGGQPCLHHATPAIKKLAQEIGEDSKKRGPGPAVKARTFRETTHGRWEWMEEVYPAYQQIRRDINKLMLMPEDASLEPKYREIVVAAVLACRAYPTVPHHLRRAVQEGANVEEMVEAMQVAALLAGAPVFHHASPFIIEIQKDVEAGKLVPAPVAA
jgi:alkylhydroperoxidase/carboxymuconolactone decarboxylase family protein YurZ